MSNTEASKRSRQVSDLIHRELAMILRRGTNDQRLTKLSITEVDVAPNLRSARVYYTLLDTQGLQDVKKALVKGAGFLRQRVADNVALRYTPKLEFFYDDNLEKAEKLTHILQGI